MKGIDVMEKATLYDEYMKDEEFAQLMMKEDIIMDVTENLTTILNNRDFKEFSKNLGTGCLKIELTASSRLLYAHGEFFYEVDRDKMCGPLRKEEKINSTERLVEILIGNGIGPEQFMNSLNKAIKKHAEKGIS